MPIPPPVPLHRGAAGAFPLGPFALIVGSALAFVLGAFLIAGAVATRGWPWQRRRQPALAPLAVGQHGFYQTFPPGLLSTRLADVAGLGEARRELAEIIDFLRAPARYERLGARIPRGFLLYGPPGTGKTLLAKAISGEASAAFFHASGAAFVEKYVGVGAGRIRELFTAARRLNSPAIIFLDEIDALARRRGQEHAEADQTLNQLLVEMDGFQTAAHPHPLIVVAATNRLDTLDPAILRPGRFDRHVAVDLPDAAGRQQILARHTRGKPLAADVDLATLAQQTIGLSGADLENLCNEAAIVAARRDASTITGEDFLVAIDRQIAGLPSHRTVLPDDLRRVAVHEVGHALLSWLNGQVAVHKISIIPHGRALGYTVPVPTAEHYLDDVDTLWRRLLGLLGGRAAELVVFGSASTGAADDFQRATALVQDMVHHFGLTTWGLAYVDQPGPDAAHAIVSDILEHGLAVACDNLHHHRAAVDAAVAVLLRQEVITWTELQTLWAAIPQGDLPPFPDANAWTYYQCPPLT